MPNDFDPMEAVNQEFDERMDAATDMAEFVDKATQLGYPVMVAVDFGEEGVSVFSFNWDEEDEEDGCGCPPGVCMAECEPVVDFDLEKLIRNSFQQNFVDPAFA